MATNIDLPEDAMHLAASSVELPEDTSYLAASCVELPEDAMHLAARSIDLPEDTSYLAASSIDLPEHIIEEIKQHISEINRIARMQQIETIVSDIRFQYHLFLIRWVAKEFWGMKRTDPHHPRKIDTLANSHNFPSDWLPSSIKPAFDYGTGPFTEHYNYFMKYSTPDFK